MPGCIPCEGARAQSTPSPRRIAAVGAVAQGQRGGGRLVQVLYLGGGRAERTVVSDHE